MQSKRAVVITGPVGSGQSSTAKALAESLEYADISCAFIDMDTLRWFHPTPSDDPFGEAVGYRHVRMMAETYAERGIPTLILADVIETVASRQKLAGAIPGYQLLVVRLDVPMEILKQRLRLRETECQQAWHFNRARELQEIMLHNRIGDVVIPVGTEGVDTVAQRVGQELGLL